MGRKRKRRRDLHMRRMLLMKLGATQKGVTLLDLFESLLPNVFEVAVTENANIGGEVESWSICIKVKRNHIHADFMRKCSNLYHVCDWPFKKGGAEECIKMILYNFGGRRRIVKLRDWDSRKEYSMTNIPNFETIEEFEMKLMLSGRDCARKNR